MVAKDIIFEEEARNALRSGINELADAVSITLGPKGRSVGLQASFGAPSITSDGASIAQEIELSDPFLNMGASMAKEVASKIKEKAGDGTTTGIVLLQALVAEGLRNSAAGANPIALKRGMDKALSLLLEKIEQSAIQVQTDADTKDVATIAASHDPEIGMIISDALKKVTKTGVVTIEEGKGMATSIQIVDGMELDRGYLSSYFATNAEKMTAELENPYLLITDKKISAAQEILQILQHVAEEGASLLIIAEDIDGDALSTLVMNKLRGTIKVAAIKAPGFGAARAAILEDIAAISGAQLISNELGILLKNASADVLGRADKILISKDKTVIIGGIGDREEVKTRLARIKEELKTASSYEKEMLEKRQAKLDGGVAVISVGALTEAERNKKKQQFEDSLHATRAALEEGICLGGGVGLVQAVKSCKRPSLEREEMLGAEILYRACEAPFRQLVKNSGYDASVALHEALEKGSSFGFNVLTEKVEDFTKARILDPVKVIKTSLTHAVSMAGVIFLTESLIVPAKDK